MSFVTAASVGFLYHSLLMKCYFLCAFASSMRLLLRLVVDKRRRTHDRNNSAREGRRNITDRAMTE